MAIRIEDVEKGGVASGDKYGMINKGNKNTTTSTKHYLKHFIYTFIATTVIFSYYIIHLRTQRAVINHKTNEDTYEDVCPLGEILRPQTALSNNATLEEILYSQSYLNYTINNLRNAIKIPTVSYDHYKSPSEQVEGEDEWAIFPEFHAFLEQSFPLVHQTFSVEKINKYGLLLSWEGQNKTLKPQLYMAHIDVVPVEPVTLHSWIHPPFEGVVDDDYLYGRGASDTKGLVIAYFQAFERLIQDGFVPQRGFVIALGFDEEIGGRYGATEISKVLQARYGKKSFFSISDEGGASIEVIDGVPFASIPVAEKGIVGIEVDLITPGGHSSIPPDHTNIGIMAQLVNEIERTPFLPSLAKENPTLGKLQCIAKYTDTYPQTLKNDIFKSSFDKDSNQRVVDFIAGNRNTRFQVSTTQAVDIIQGGVKSNALPEFSKIIINHRIALDSNIDATVRKILTNVQAIADNHDLGIQVIKLPVFPGSHKPVVERNTTGSNGHFEVKYTPSLNPAPISPLDSAPFQILTGALKHVLTDHLYPESEGYKESVVTGAIMSGNTDTNHFWDLTDDIYRFTFAVNEGDKGLLGSNIHTVNERVKVKDLVGSVGFIYQFTRLVNEYEGY